MLEFGSVVEDVYDASHLEEGQQLGQAILSTFPLTNHSFTLFRNPHKITTGPRGERWDSHDKGVSSCVLQIGQARCNVKTCHSFPYRRYAVDPLSMDMKSLREDMANKCMPLLPVYLLQSDLNYDADSARELLPALFYEGVQEITLHTRTTPKGKAYDHVLYRGLDYVKSFVDDSVFTDHFPVICEFNI